MIQKITPLDGEQSKVCKTIRNTHTSYNSLDPQNKLRVAMSNIALRSDDRVPPRYSHEPRVAYNADALKEAKTTVVPKSAVMIMDGSNTITPSIKGPKPTPAIENQV